jgi:hypothetical protein
MSPFSTVDKYILINKTVQAMQHSVTFILTTPSFVPALAYPGEVLAFAKRKKSLIKLTNVWSEKKNDLWLDLFSKQTQKRGKEGEHEDERLDSHMQTCTTKAKLEFATT